MVSFKIHAISAIAKHFIMNCKVIVNIHAISVIAKHFIMNYKVIVNIYKGTTLILEPWTC